MSFLWAEFPHRDRDGNVLAKDPNDKFVAVVRVDLISTIYVDDDGEVVVALQGEDFAIALPNYTVAQAYDHVKTARLRAG